MQDATLNRGENSSEGGGGFMIDSSEEFHPKGWLYHRMNFMRGLNVRSGDEVFVILTALFTVNVAIITPNVGIEEVCAPHHL